MNFTLFLNSSPTIHSILVRFKKKISFFEESVLGSKKKNKCCRYNRIQKPKVLNIEAKHTNLIGVFRIQETAQLELGL